MKNFFILIILSTFSLTVKGQETVNCIIKTSIGDISIKLYPHKAPITVTNFLRYIDQHLYDSTSFFRVCTPENEKDREIKIEVIQGGDIREDQQFLPIEIETTKLSGIKHNNGTISMARDTPNSATSSFFICIGDQPELDYNGRRNPDGYGFAAFGKVTKGMDVVKKIQGQKDINQNLETPILIYSIQRIP